MVRAGDIDVVAATVKEAPPAALDVALAFAALGDRKDIAELLLRHGACVDADIHKGFTPLHCASQRGHLRLVKLLLARGANVNAAMHDGRTSLYLAAEEGHRE
eukprot:44821-Eustigmatos_ZCMA.PRE.1